MMYWKTKLGDCSLFRGLGTNVSNLLSTATRMTWSNFLSQVRLFLYVLWFNQVSCIMEVSEILRYISYILEKVAFRCARNCQVKWLFLLGSEIVKEFCYFLCEWLLGRDLFSWKSHVSLPSIQEIYNCA
jgi:hypothetical protein